MNLLLFISRSSLDGNDQQGTEQLGDEQVRDSLLFPIIDHRCALVRLLMFVDIPYRQLTDRRKGEACPSINYN